MNAVVFALTGMLALLLSITVWNALAAPRLRLRPRDRLGVPRVSLLIPARNEAERLPAVLSSALEHVTAHQILVLDDQSTDATAAVVREYERASAGRVQLVAGQPLPAGWLGKNWACHQLAAGANGQLLVFCDADVMFDGDAVAASWTLLERHGAGVLTALPRQAYRSWWDRALIPLVLHLPLLSLLPLPLVPRVRAPSLVFGNGQWLAFRRDAYRTIGGHAAVRAAVVEDMALVVRAKQRGVRVVSALGGDLLTVRMYAQLRDMMMGFAKNLYPLLGAKPHLVAGAIAFFLCITVAPVALAAASPLPLALLVALRVLHTQITGGRLLDLILHPLGVALALVVVAHSALAYRNGTVTWKSRKLPARVATPSA